MRLAFVSRSLRGLPVPPRTTPTDFAGCSGRPPQHTDAFSLKAAVETSENAHKPLRMHTYLIGTAYCTWSVIESQSPIKGRQGVAALGVGG